MAIIGLGMEGQDALKFLGKTGAEITVFDQKEKEELDIKQFSIFPSKTRLAESGNFQFSIGQDYLKKGLKGFDYIVRSPGVRPDLPEIQDAAKFGSQLTSAIKIFFALCPAQIIGVTGTKGKGTTASLIHEILKASGRTSYLAGNIGYPYLELLTKLTRSDLVTLELSSFQLIDTVKSPHIAVVINISTDHLDWHKDRNEYVKAKENIVKFQTKNDLAVLMKDYQTPASFAQKTKGKVYWASIKQKVRGSYVNNGIIYLNVDEKTLIGPTDKLLLRGRHNWENVTCAVVASYLAGATLEGIKKAVFSFRGLPHRLELVGVVNGVSFYNDSFATSPGPVLAAVHSFSEPMILILGGSSKGLDYQALGKELSKLPNLKAVLIIGEVGGEIKRELMKSGFRGKLTEGGKNMREIIKNTISLAKSGDVVLLSPAAASFDMFKNYKDRGMQFNQEVLKLV